MTLSSLPKLKFPRRLRDLSRLIIAKKKPPAILADG